MSTNPAPTVDHLRLVVRTFLRGMDERPYAHLRQGQKPPLASIPFGTGGLAYALWCFGARRPERRAQADKWLLAAARSAPRWSAFRCPELTDAMLEHSCHFSNDGIRWARLLIGHAGVQSRKLLGRAFLARCLRMRGGPTEFLIGSAGYLYAATLLWHRTGDPCALSVADVLARDLLDRAERGPQAWTRADNLGFAHGRTGTFHALLAWSRADRPLPRRFFAALDDLAEAAERAGMLGQPSSPENPFLASWCNGAAGLVLLWARAYEQTGDPAHLRLARMASRFVVTAAPRVSGNLCCGHGGHAYALLAMDRIEPGAGWYDQALELALRAMLRMTEHTGEWPNGLYKGFPGLVCLAQDLLSKPVDRRGFPLADEALDHRKVKRMRPSSGPGALSGKENRHEAGQGRCAAGDLSRLAGLADPVGSGPSAG